MGKQFAGLTVQVSSPAMAAASLALTIPSPVSKWQPCCGDMQEAPNVDGSLSSFVDGAQASDWAQSAMIWAVDQELITGVGHNQLESCGQATRAQAATLLMRFAGKRLNKNDRALQ